MPGSSPGSPAVSQGRPALQLRVAFVVIAWAISEPLLLDGDGSRWTALAFGLLVALPLLAVRRFAWPAAIVVILGYLTQYALGQKMHDAMSGEMAVAFALFGTGAYSPAGSLRTGAALVLAAAVPGGLWLASALDLGELESVFPMQYVYLGGVAFAGVLPGFALAGRRREVLALDRDVAWLCEQAATEIAVAVDAERRALGRDLVRVVEALVADVQRLVAQARDGIAAGASERFGGQMADAASRAAAELRRLLHALSDPAGEPRGTPPRPRRFDGARARDAIGLAGPVVLLAALGIVDRAELPPLPVTLMTTSGSELAIGTSAVPAPVGYLLAALTPLGLLWRRRAPLAATAAVATVVVLRAATDELNSIQISHLFVFGAMAYNAGAWSPSRERAAAGLLLTVAVTVLCWRWEEYRFEPLVYAYMLGVLTATWGLGRAVRPDLRAAFALRRRADELRRQRDRLLATAVRGQRRDVAREMHDVVGHGLSLIVVQSGVVDVLAARDPGRALAALELVDDATRATQAELRALRTALGSPAPDAADTARHCRQTLERIVAEARAAGQPVLAHLDPRVEELDPDQRTALVRITQEALTNARKHAGAAAATLEVEVRADLVSLRVRNEAGRPLAAAPPGSRLGLRGMAERAGAQGGRLEAGPDADGGWTVRAELPRAIGVGRWEAAAPIR